MPVAAQLGPVAAASDEPAQEADGDDLHDPHRDSSGQIVVTARGLRRLDVLAGTSVISDDTLQRNQSGQLGEVLARLPGVTASGFGPGASRPILRGFSGERVRVLIDGLGIIDVSNTSDDHGVAIDSLTAERIEVLRGPAVLVYGSQAIGGAVNVIDKRIPRRISNEPLHLDGLAGYDSVNDQTQLGASIDAPLGGGLVIHANGSRRDAGNLSVPGFVASPALRARLLAAADEEERAGKGEEADELRDAASRRFVLPNSSFTSWTAGVGGAFFAGESTLGASASWYGSRYGIPERPGAGHAPEAGEGEGDPAPVSIDMNQFRVDLRGALALGDGFLDRLVTRVGYTDYAHTEFEGDEVGTVFAVNGIEARAEFVQRPTAGLTGLFGLQYYFRDFNTMGAEAFVAPNRTDQFGAFVLQELGLGPVELEAAARYERTGVRSAPLGLARAFNAVSGALGAGYDLSNTARAGVTASRVHRAPSGEELFANGPHVATQAFEVGNPDLTMERAWGIEAYLRGRLGPAEVSLALYRNWFDDYIYLAQTGVERNGLPEFAFVQNRADHFGVEGEVSLPLHRSEALILLADMRGDYIRAALADGSPLPRIPPLSLLGALEARGAAWAVRVEAQWFARQNRVAAFETPSDAFAFVNTSLSWKPVRGNDSITLLAQADNIFDIEGRRHASLTRDFVPLPGRNVKLSARVSF